MKTCIRNHPILAFTIVAYLFSWACWLPVLGDIQADLFGSGAGVVALLTLGGYGPTVAAVLLSTIIGGWPALRDLLRKLLVWRAGLRWYFAVLLIGPVVYAGALYLYGAISGETGAVNYGLLPWIPVIVLASIPFGPLGEELGWRGFALPRLDASYGFVGSSMMLGVIWTFWHAPLFWAATGTAVSGFPVTVQSVSIFFLAVTGSSFIYTWVFRNTHGSVLMAVLLHLSLNAAGTVAGMLFPEMNAEDQQSAYYYYVAVLWALVFGGAAGSECWRRWTAIGPVNRRQWK